MTKLIFDTNVIISSAMLSDSLPAKSLNKGINEGIILYSDATIEELFKVLERPKLRPFIKQEFITEFYHQITMNWQYVPILQRVNSCRDPNDDKFIELALNSDANFLITGDKDLLVMNPYRNTSIITPKEYLS